MDTEQRPAWVMPGTAGLGWGLPNLWSGTAWSTGRWERNKQNSVSLDYCSQLYKVCICRWEVWPRVKWEYSVGRILGRGCGRLWAAGLFAASCALVGTCWEAVLCGPVGQLEASCVLIRRMQDSLGGRKDRAGASGVRRGDRLAAVQPGIVDFHILC